MLRRLPHGDCGAGAASCAMTIGHTYRANPRETISALDGRRGASRGRLRKARIQFAIPRPHRATRGWRPCIPTWWPEFSRYSAFTPTARLGAAALNSLFSALTAGRCMRLRVKPWACGWHAGQADVGAAAYSMYWAIRWVWRRVFRHSCSRWFFCWRYGWRGETIRATARLDAVWGGVGLIALANPSCLSFLPFALAWPCINFIASANAGASGADGDTGDGWRGGAMDGAQLPDLRQVRPYPQQLWR